MAGVNTILNEILQQAEEEAKGILQEANAQADSVKAAAEADAQEIRGRYAEKAEQDAKNYDERISSQIDLKRRQALLSAKQSVISEIIGKAYDKLMAQDENAYFEMIKKVLAENIDYTKDGEILFSKKDKDRLPFGFLVDMQLQGFVKGGGIKVSSETANIDSGFILRYGGIDQNCSLKALFSEKQEELQDIVHRVIW